MPFDQRTDVHGDIAFAVFQFAGEVVERERLRFEIKQGEDAALQLVQDAGRSRSRPDAVHEDCARSIHCTLRLEYLENSERTVKMISEQRFGSGGGKRKAPIATWRCSTFFKVADHAPSAVATPRLSVERLRGESYTELQPPGLRTDERFRCHPFSTAHDGRPAADAAVAVRTARAEVVARRPGYAARLDREVCAPNHRRTSNAMLRDRVL